MGKWGRYDQNTSYTCKINKKQFLGDAGNVVSKHKIINQVSQSKFHVFLSRLKHLWFGSQMLFLTAVCS